MFRVGNCAGFSGDRVDAATPVVDTLIELGGPCAIFFEVLGERTVALAQLEKRRDPERGYEPMLERLLEPILVKCATHGIPIIGKTIDTHGTHDTLSPAALHQHRDAWSGSRTIGRRGELFKVCNHDIGSAGECCFLCLKVQSGGEQPTAAQRHGSAQRCKGTH